MRTRFGNTDVEAKDPNTTAEAGADVDAMSRESVVHGDGRRQIVPYLGLKTALPYSDPFLIKYDYINIIISLLYANRTGTRFALGNPTPFRRDD